MRRKKNLIHRRTELTIVLCFEVVGVLRQKHLMQRQSRAEAITQIVIRSTRKHYKRTYEYEYELATVTCKQCV